MIILGRISKAMASGSNLQTATAQGLADFEARERTISHLRAIIRLTETIRKSAHQVEIYIYLTVNSVLQLVIELIRFY